MTAVTYLTRHRRPGIVILCSIVAVLSMLFVLPPAIASAADSGAQAVDECNPTASNGCVNGILQDADKKPIADGHHHAVRQGNRGNQNRGGRQMGLLRCR